MMEKGKKKVLQGTVNPEAKKLIKKDSFISIIKEFFFNLTKMKQTVQRKGIQTGIYNWMNNLFIFFFETI